MSEQSAIRNPQSAIGWFGPGSMLRKVGQESVGMLGGGRALLMQLAHPMVAAGVAEHSKFTADPLTRLENTLDIMMSITFGDQRQARDALRRFHAVHTHVKGRLPYAAGPFPAGTSYTAADPELKMWVHATMIDTSLMAYERFVAPLSPAQRARFYDETRLFARLIAIPEALVPPTLEDFEEYMQAMLASDVLTVTKAARRLARDVLYPPVGIAPRAGGPLLRFVTAGLLPERLREDFGLSWDERQQAMLDAFSRLISLALPFTPSWLRKFPDLQSTWLYKWALTAGRPGAKGYGSGSSSGSEP